jgi:hypothetical protein
VKKKPKKSREAAAGRAQPVSPGRRRWMRLAAATLVPLFILGALELGLRLAGHPSAVR